jgi:hypothetical protein|tara:strand:+ start:844 stop:1017 length:174 start_codon:yes stop_codon:yes gene_type:complete
MRDIKIKYINKEGHEVVHHRENATKEQHKSDMEKIKKEINQKFGLVVLLQKQMEMDI